jgi:hypothetical protein
MTDNKEIIINLNNNRGGILSLIERQQLADIDSPYYYIESKKADNAPRLTYRYNLSGEQCASIGDAGHNIPEVCTKLGRILGDCRVKERGLTIILKSDLKGDSTSDGIVDIDDLRSIKNKLSKEFKNIQLMF